jgi:hypothetical protein
MFFETKHLVVGKEKVNTPSNLWQKRVLLIALTVRGVQSLLVDAHPSVDITCYHLFQQDDSIKSAYSCVRDEIVFVEYVLPFSSESFIVCLLKLTEICKTIISPAAFCGSDVWSRALNEHRLSTSDYEVLRRTFWLNNENVVQWCPYNL